MTSMNEPITLLSGDRMYLDDLDSMELRTKRIYEEKETKFIEWFIKPNMTCVDVGAFIGYYTIMMAKKARRVLAFEPDPENFLILQRNIALNGLTDKVSAYCFAVGHPGGGSIEANRVTLYKCATNKGMHRIYPSKWCDGGSERVSLYALEGIAKHADFFKIDVEGSEFGVLQGMRQILEENRPTVLMEFHVPSIREYGANPLEILNYMLKLDYEIALVDRPVSDYTQVLRYGEGPGFNILCRPNR